MKNIFLFLFIVKFSEITTDTQSNIKNIIQEDTFRSLTPISSLKRDFYSDLIKKVLKSSEILESEYNGIKDKHALKFITTSIKFISAKFFNQPTKFFNSSIKKYLIEIDLQDQTCNKHHNLEMLYFIDFFRRLVMYDSQDCSLIDENIEQKSHNLVNLLCDEEYKNEVLFVHGYTTAEIVNVVSYILIIFTLNRNFIYCSEHQNFCKLKDFEIQNGVLQNLLDDTNIKQKLPIQNNLQDFNLQDIDLTYLEIIKRQNLQRKTNNFSIFCSSLINEFLVNKKSKCIIFSGYNSINSKEQKPDLDKQGSLIELRLQNILNIRFKKLQNFKPDFIYLKINLDRSVLMIASFILKLYGEMNHMCHTFILTRYKNDGFIKGGFSLSMTELTNIKDSPDKFKEEYETCAISRVSILYTLYKLEKMKVEQIFRDKEILIKNVSYTEKINCLKSLLNIQKSFHSTSKWKILKKTVVKHNSIESNLVSDQISIHLREILFNLKHLLNSDYKLNEIYKEGIEILQNLEYIEFYKSLVKNHRHSLYTTLLKRKNSFKRPTNYEDVKLIICLFHNKRIQETTNNKDLELLFLCHLYSLYSEYKNDNYKIIYRVARRINSTNMVDMENLVSEVVSKLIEEEYNLEANMQFCITTIWNIYFEKNENTDLIKKFN